MRKFIRFFLATGLIPLVFAEQKPKDLLAAALHVNGECYYERDGKTLPAKARTIFFKNDRVYTKKGKIDIQIGPAAVLHLPPYSTVKLSTFFEADAKTNIAVELEAGRGYTKFSKPMAPGSRYEIRTPTITAGVRGTEFILSAGDTPVDPKAEDADIPSGVFVNHGKVAVSTAEHSGDEIEVPAGEQVRSGSNNELVKGVMDDFMKKKMQMFKRLNTMREEQYRLLERERNRQQELLDKVRGSVNMEDAGSAVERMKRKNQERFRK